jgi:hypothetical protein
MVLEPIGCKNRLSILEAQPQGLFHKDQLQHLFEDSLHNTNDTSSADTFDDSSDSCMNDGGRKPSIETRMMDA